jgi:hypothetical protein
LQKTATAQLRHCQWILGCLLRVEASMPSIEPSNPGRGQKGQQHKQSADQHVPVADGTYVLTDG